MTTKKELAEMILESEITGRALQRRKHGSRTWVPSLSSIYDLNDFEYRLAPKIVKHERWVILHDNLGYPAEEKAKLRAGENEVRKITWETEE